MTIKKEKITREKYCDGYDLFVIEHIEQDVNDGYLTDDEGEYLKHYTLHIVWRMFSYFSDKPDAGLDEELEKFDSIINELLNNRK